MCYPSTKQRKERKPHIMVSGRRSYSSASAGGALKPLPPVSSKAKDYTERPDEVVDELDDLRTRGIAKVLNKHFTTTTRQLAIEKAEADAALADLERRRAQTKAFVPSKGGDLNPSDQLYMQLQKKRAECRRKEKETMMLYQRYVMKYGKSAKAAPLVAAAPSSTEPQEAGKDDSLRGSGNNTELETTPSRSALGTLDENSEITFSKFYEKQLEDQERERELKRENEEKNTQHFVSALNKFMTVTEDGEEEQQEEGNGVPELVPSKDSGHPSPVKPDPFMSAINKFTATAGSDDVAEESESQDVAEQEEAQNEGDADVSEPVAASPDTTKTPLDDLPTTDASDSVFEDESMVSEQQDNNENNKEPEPSPQKTVVNGNLTPATKQKPKEAVTPSETPEVVPETATTLSPSSHHSTPKSNKVVRVEVNESPYFQSATVEGYDIDERSIISELTSANSAVTRQLMDEVETEMEDFIKFEMEAIKKMLDDEDASTVDQSVKSETSSVMLADQSVHVAIKAEAMALEMQKILDDFAKEDASASEASKSILNESFNESIQSPEQKSASAAQQKSVYPYKFEPAIPGQEWYVHFADEYQREFYIEKISGKTQWEYPKKVPTPREQPISSDDFLSDMHSVASSRRSTSRRSSRRSLYRKERKKRRQRRLIMSFFALLCVLATVFYWRAHHPDESIAGAMAAFVVSLKNMDAVEVVNRMVDEYEYYFTDRKMREEKEQELIRQEQVNIAKEMEKEKKARDLAAAKRAKEEAERIAMEKARLKAAKVAREEAARKLAEEQEAARQQQLARERELQAELEVQKLPELEKEKTKGRRHQGCNIPFAYLIPHCWRMAKTHPPFGLKNENDLVFLQ